MDIELLIATTILLSYLLYISIKFGVQESISASYQVIKQKWLFTLVLWGVAIPIMIAGNHVLLFLAGAGICFVGASPEYWKTSEKTVHVLGATLGISLAITWIFLYFSYLVAILYLIFIILFEFKFKNKRILKLKNHLWWTEVIAFITLLFSLWFKN